MEREGPGSDVFLLQCFGDELLGGVSMSYFAVTRILGCLSMEKFYRIFLITKNDAVYKT